jgi:UPF0271 protein
MQFVERRRPDEGQAQIDLNADLGEGFGIWKLGDDEALLDLVTSANVACGFHAGDAITMSNVCVQARVRGVQIGAQVGYRDLAGFGRRAMDVPSDELSADIIYQIGALDAFVRMTGSEVHYVKPHGALYNTAMVDERVAEAVASAVGSYAPGRLALLGMPGSALAAAATANSVPYVTEAFADRRYTADGWLLPRSAHGAVISDPAAVIEQALRLAPSADSLCLHGDTPGAADLARQVRDALIDAGVAVRPFR